MKAVKRDHFLVRGGEIPYCLPVIRTRPVYNQPGNTRRTNLGENHIYFLQQNRILQMEMAVDHSQQRVYRSYSPRLRRIGIICE